MELNATQLLKVKEYIAGTQSWKYPDMQVAISDHIKYRIQDLMAENRTMTIEQAVNIAHNEFGPKGFKIFEVETKATLKNKYDKMFWEAITRQFNFKSFLITTTAILWFYLFFTDVKMPETHGIWSALFPVTLFFPHYLVTLSMLFNPAKRYKKYFALSIGNVTLFRWLYIGLVINMIWYFVSILREGADYLLLTSITDGIIFFAWVVLLHAGYAVRHAALNDCRQTEAQNSALSA